MRSAAIDPVLDPAVDERSIDADRSIVTLLDGARRRDGSAFAGLFEAFATRVHAFVAARGVVDADGLTNEVFIRTFLDTRRLQGPPSQFTGQLFGLARDLVRLHAYQQRAERNGRFQDLAVGDVDIETWLDLREGVDAIERVLLHLTPVQRDVLLLRVVAGLTFLEIAVALDRRPSAIRIAWRRAFSVLVESLTS